MLSFHQRGIKAAAAVTRPAPDHALELHDLHRTVATGLQRLRTRLEVAEAVPTTSAAAAPASRASTSVMLAHTHTTLIHRPIARRT
jgi:hypothetical protein